MRKLLLATSALAGVALFAGSAQADMEVTVGGYNDFRAGFFGEDLSAGAGVARRHIDFENEYQLEVEAKGKANNGMEYGVVASLWNGADYTNTPAGQNDVRLHQSYGYVNGAWGQVRAGDTHGGTDLAITAPMTYDFGGQVDGYYTEFVSGGLNAISPKFIDDDENSTKIMYLTPKLGANGHSIQVGAVYMPNMYGQGQQVTLTNPGAAANVYRDVFEVGARYEGKFMDKVSTAASFVYVTGDGTNGNIPNLAAGQSARDFSLWEVGGQVGYAGFTVGGNYTDAGRLLTVAGQDNKQQVFSVGASYKFDRASVAGSYLLGSGYNNMQFGALATANDSTTPASWQNYSAGYQAWGIGAGYSLFDGMTTSVDATFFKQERPAGVGNDEGHVVILSNRIAF